MFNSSFRRLFLLALCLLAFAGCGSGENNGTLTLDVSPELSAGVYKVTASATYSNATASNLSNTPITFTFTARSASGTVPDPYTVKVYTNDSGVAPPVDASYLQINEAVSVTVTATTGDLRQSKTVELAAAQ